MLLKSNQTLLVIVSFVFASFCFNNRGICQYNIQTVSYITDFNDCNENPWHLVFFQNFDGTSLDKDIWRIETGVTRDVNFDQQKAWHQKENIVVQNSQMQIIVNDEAQTNMYVDFWPKPPFYTDFLYTSGEIITKRKFGRGKFEAMVTLHKPSYGLFPAFWLYTGSPIYSEIDIFEFFGEYTYSDEWKTNVHTDHDQDGTRCSVEKKIPFSDNYDQPHVYGLIWDATKIIWYRDKDPKRIDYKRTLISGSNANCIVDGFVPYLLNKDFPYQPMHMIFNVAIKHGGDSAPFNSSFMQDIYPLKGMVVDWVKYSKQETCDDKLINSMTELQILPQEFNSISGNSVELGGSVSISNNQLEAVGINYVTLNPGFFAGNKTEFVARCDSNLCSSSFDDKKRISNKPTGNANIKGNIYPNPAKEFVSLSQLNLDPLKKYTIVIASTNGQIVFQVKNTHLNSKNVNISNLRPGSYIIQILDTETLLLHNFKLIKL